MKKMEKLLENKIILTGNVNVCRDIMSIPLSGGQDILNWDKFLHELQALMVKYEVSKIDVAFDIFQLKL